MSSYARFCAAVLLFLSAFTMAAPTGTTTTTPTSHHLHAYLTTVANNFAFETATARPTLTHHPIIMERRNDPHIKIHEDGSLYSDSNITTTTHYQNTMEEKEKKKERTHPRIRISRDGFFLPLSQGEAHGY